MYQYLLPPAVGIDQDGWAILTMELTVDVPVFITIRVHAGWAILTVTYSHCFVAVVLSTVLSRLNVLLFIHT
jgi:hypothetical protein